MKTVMRIVICAVFLFVSVGGGILVAAAIMGKSDAEKGKGLTSERNTFEVEEEFSDIHAEDVECNLHILPAPDDKCKVVCPQRQGSIYHTVEVRDGVLSVRCRVKRKWYQYIGITFGTPDVEIYLPEKAYGQLQARTVAGSIRVEEGFTFESAGLESTSGSVRMYAEVKEELRSETISGRITIENASPQMLTAKSGSGRVELSHIRSGEIKAETISGRIELTDVIAEKDLYAESTSGGVVLDGCDGGTIIIETTSGSVEGTVLSDKVFTAKSTSGSVRVPFSSAGGECEISTTSGSVSLSVIQ